ncbi:MAG: hypothetical protein ACC628_08175 [Pirellulaceae bacterium]
MDNAEILKKVASQEISVEEAKSLMAVEEMKSCRRFGAGVEEIAGWIFDPKELEPPSDLTASKARRVLSEIADKLDALYSERQSIQDRLAPLREAKTDLTIACIIGLWKARHDLVGFQP